MIKRKFKQVTLKEYKAIKSMLDAEVARGIVGQPTARLWPTVKFIEKSTSFENFKIISRSTVKKVAPIIAPVRAIIGSEVVKQKEEQSIIPLLTRIVEALELMEGHWRPIENQPKRFKLF